MKLCPRCGSTANGADWVCTACGERPERKGRRLILSSGTGRPADGFEARFFERLAGLEAKNFWFRARNRLLAWALRRHFPRAKSLLEVGCGTGFVLAMLEREFPSLELSGSEMFQEGLEFAEGRLSRARLFQIDARRIPFQDEFDVVGAFDVVEHILEDEQVLAEMSKAVKPGGGIILTVPQHKFLWSQVDDYSHHHRRYSAPELRGKLEKAGFTVVMTSSFVTLLLPLVFISRYRFRKQFSEKDATAEFDIGPLANFLLERVLGIEIWMIERGVRFPMGSTLLMVATSNKLSAVKEPGRMARASGGER